ncbi:glucosyl transferase [filamentous cyanobacterium CCP3]|nr:glucosyl transferase [filamentous cyanobacterium CCP3]
MSSLNVLNPVEGKPILDLRQSQYPNSFRKGVRFVWFRLSSLLLADAAAITAAWLGASAVSMHSVAMVDLASSLNSAIPVLAIGYSIFSTGKFYQSGTSRKDYLGLVSASIMLAITVFILFKYAQIFGPGLTEIYFLVFGVLAAVLIPLNRFVVDIATNKLRQLGLGLYPVFVIADAPKQKGAANLIKSEGHYKVLGMLDAKALDRNQRESTFETLNRLGIIEVFVDWEAIENRLFICGLFQSEGYTLRILPNDELPPPSTITYTAVGEKLCLSFTPFVLSGLEFWTKRAFDVVAASVAVVLASPIYLLIALLIYIDSPGPIFYKQTRIGLKNKPFKVWKFRTMVPNADKLQKELEAKNETKDGVLFKIKDDPRITRVGKVLRAYSLDELPQLFNVVLGEMSLVGPRPLPLRDVEKFSQHHHIRQEVLPGITGLWQISGRSDIVDFEEAYQLDLTYITRWSIWLDLQILFKTVGVVLKKSGAY